MSCFIRLRGLPWSVTHQEVLDFLKNVKVVNGTKGVHMVVSKFDGKSTGEAFVELESTEDENEALKLNKNMIGHRYIEIFTASNEEAEEALKNPASNAANVLKLRGLPYEISEQMIEQFFDGLQLKRNGILICMDRRGRVSGEAYVQFENPEDTEEALLRNKEKIGHRYIEIFRSSFAEMRRHMNNGRPAPYDVNNRGGFRNNNFGGNNGGGGFGGNGNMNNMRDSGFGGNNRNGNWGNNGGGGGNRPMGMNNSGNGFNQGGGGGGGGFGMFGGGSGGFNNNSGNNFNRPNNMGMGNNSGGGGGGNFGQGSPWNNDNNMNRNMGGGLNNGMGQSFGGNNNRAFNNGNNGGNNMAKPFGRPLGGGGGGGIGGGGMGGLGGLGASGGMMGGGIGGGNGIGIGGGMMGGGNIGAGIGGGMMGGKAGGIGGVANMGGNGGGMGGGSGFNNMSNNFGNNRNFQNDDDDDDVNDDLFRIHMRGLPYNTYENEVCKFFQPVRPDNVKIIFNQKGLHSGTADAYFSSYDDAQIAMKKHKEQIGNRYIELFFDGQGGGGNRDSRQNF